jgi:HSP20 family protein
MTLVPFTRGALRDFMSLHEAVDRLLSESVVPSQNGDTGGLVLPIDVYEEDDSYVISAALPGVRPEDVQIEVTPNGVSISAEMNDEREIKEGQYIRRERRFGRFQRVIELPVELDPDRAQASVENGVLRLRVPKTESRKPKQVKVTSGGSEQQQKSQSQSQQQQQQQRQSGNGRETQTSHETRETKEATAAKSGRA